MTSGLAALAGAQPGEVVAMNSLTVNLHLMLASFYRPAAGRTRILIEANAFPSDRHALASQISWHGLDPRTELLELQPADDSGQITTEQIEYFLDASRRRDRAGAVAGNAVLERAGIRSAAYRGRGAQGRLRRGL